MDVIPFDELIISGTAANARLRASEKFLFSLLRRNVVKASLLISELIELKPTVKSNTLKNISIPVNIDLSKSVFITDVNTIVVSPVNISICSHNL